MSNTQHTPGPWTTAHHGEWIKATDSKHGEVIVAKAEFNWQANARLITSAPDLLAQLEIARDRIKDMLAADDGQAFKEARKCLPGIDRVVGYAKGGEA